MSSEGKRWTISVCTRCFLPLDGSASLCECSVEDFAPDDEDMVQLEVCIASEVERLRSAIHSYLTWCEQTAWKPGDVDGLRAALADEKKS